MGDKIKSAIYYAHPQLDKSIITSLYKDIKFNIFTQLLHFQILHANVFRVNNGDTINRRMQTKHDVYIVVNPSLSAI